MSIVREIQSVQARVKHNDLVESYIEVKIEVPLELCLFFNLLKSIILMYQFTSKRMIRVQSEENAAPPPPPPPLAPPAPPA